MKKIIFLIFFIVGCFTYSKSYAQVQLDSDWNWIHAYGTENSLKIQFNSGAISYFIKIVNPMHDTVDITYGPVTKIHLEPDEALYLFVSDTPVIAVQKDAVLLYKILQLFK